MLFRRRISSKKRISSLPFMNISVSPAERCSAFGRASAHAFRKGSMTVECALVLPLFFLGMITLIGFMEIYQLQTEKLTNLCDRAKEMGMFAYAAGGPAEITIPALYTYESSVAVIPLPKVWMKTSVTVHSWIGYEGGSEDSKGLQPEEMIYVTVYGAVYHTDPACRHLDLSVKSVSQGSVENLRNQYGEKYHRCELCGEKAAGELVFITDTGNRYHTSEQCGGLKRTVRLVKKSDYADLPCCKDCAIR